jgi:biopolymer transport protein ExbB
MKLTSSFALLALLGIAVGVSAADAPAPVSPLEGLLDKIGAYQANESEQDRAREAEFKSNVQSQERLLKEAQEALKKEQASAQNLKKQFDLNEKALSEREDELRMQTGNLGEMFGVVRQVAGDLNTVLSDSLTGVEITERKADLDKLASAKELPTIDELEALWYTLQHEMTINGAITQFDAPVLAVDGQTQQEKVTRVGIFNALSAQGYLTFDSHLKELQELKRQPDQTSLAKAYLASTAEIAPFALDPSRGALLAMSIESPDLMERIHQGALVGYIILVIGAIGLGIAAWRLIYLERVAKRVRIQRANLTKPNSDNPLGRVLLSYSAIARPVDSAVLEAKLDEAVLKEQPALEIGQTIIKLFSGIAPLLGLLGTVTGMIVTFQAITTFGTGDPKLMAGGISQALVTTVEGLLVAIPLLLAHNWVASRSKAIMQLLDEQAAGLMAQALEEQGK